MVWHLVQLMSTLEKSIILNGVAIFRANTVCTHATHMLASSARVMIEIVDDEVHQIQHFEHTVFDWQIACHRRNGVRHPELVETGAVPADIESLPALVGKHGMRHEGIHAGGPGLLQDLAGLEQRAACLDQVVNNHDMASFSVAVLDHDCALIAFTARLAAYDELQIHALEHGREAFGGTVIGEGDAIDLGIFYLILQEGDSRLEGCDGVAMLKEEIVWM